MFPNDMLKALFFSFLFFLSALNCMAQPGGGGDPGPGQPVPIQGILFLLLAGACLGVKKIRQKNNPER
jgi:hypothetical protein